MNRTKKILSILVVFVLALVILPASIFAKGSYSASLGSGSINVGKSTSVNISSSNAAGKFTVTSSDSSVAQVSLGATWVDGKMDNSISVKGLKAGTVTITITPVNVADDEYNLITNVTNLKLTVKEEVVSSEDNTDNKPTTDKVTSVKSSNALLKTVTLKNGTIKFDSATTKYTVNVDKTVTTLGLKAEAQSSKAKVTITGDKNFKVGNNKVEIKVTAEDGTTKVYEITVVKSKYGSGPLTNLVVKGYEILPEFDPSQLNYSVEVNGISEVNVEYTLADKSSKVSVEGASNLKLGKNDVKVVVTEKDGKVTTYNIEVNLVQTEVKSDNVTWIVIIVILSVLVIVELIFIIKKNKNAKV